MKLRKGFVSNSSTTSFCICGTCFDRSEFLNQLSSEKIDELLKLDFEELDAEQVSKFLNNRNIADIPIGKKKDFLSETMEVGDFIWDIAHSAKLAYHRNDYTVYIGLEIDLMQDNETKAQFCQRTTESLKKAGFNNEAAANPEFIIDGWYDG